MQVVSSTAFTFSSSNLSYSRALGDFLKTD